MKLYSVSISDVVPECEIPILVYEDGTASNRFADGIAGVPQAWRELAEESFDPASDPVVGEE